MNLLFINQKLQAARYSVDVFGALNGITQDDKLKQLKTLFHLMAKATHSDLFTNELEKLIFLLI